MDFRCKPVIRYTSLISLFFFCWTFILFEPAYAVKNSDKIQVASSMSQNSSQRSAISGQSTQPKILKSEEKFQKTVDAITQIVSDTSIDTDTKKNKLKDKKSQLLSLDVEIKKQFSNTEKKLKDEGLPGGILNRHYEFVKKYENNFKELNDNLDAIDKSKTKAEADAAISRAKAHLEKVKTPSRHVPLDPNKLPFTTPEIKTFEKIEKQSVEEPKTADSLKKNAGLGKSKSPILIASAGSLDGLLAQASDDPTIIRNSPPTEADLAETLEIKFTPEILAKVAEIGASPVKLYEYVRNHFTYEPYYGSLKGSQQTLLEMAGNDIDLSSVLIALLRSANIPARYACGEIELSLDRLMNWVGGVTDPNTAAQILATAGVPGKLLTEGGKLKYAQFSHCWAEAYVSYGNYRGSSRDDSIKTWIPLDPSFKQYEYKRGMDLYTAMGINGEQYIQDYIMDTSPSPIPPELQGLFPDYTISPYQYYSKRLLNYIDSDFPDSTIEDIIGDETIALTKTIIKKEYPYLLGSLPYKVVTRGSTYSAILNNLRPSISLTIENPLTYEIDLSYSTTFPDIAGKRITLSYVPATSTDEELVTKYGGLLNVPPYLLNVKPVIKVNGIIVATGNTVGLGYDQIFNMTFRMPNKGTDIVTNKVTTGDYSAIAIQYYKTPSNLVADKMETLIGNIGSTDLDDLLGQMLYNIGLSYFHHLTFEEELYAKNFQMVITKEPSEVIITSQAITEYLWGVPFRVTEGGVGVDVDRNISASFSIDGNQQRKKDFMIVSGLGSSAWEDMILETFLNIPSVSASRLLKIANQRGIPIYTIDSGNINTILPQLQVTSDVTDNIRNAVNAGKKVIISKSNIQYNEWNGIGYIILDPAKGSGAYLISGGLAGAGTSKKASASTRNISAYSPSNDDSLLKTIFTRQAVIQVATFYIDTPYVWGGEDPVCGFDCSGFVSYVFYVVYGGTIFPVSFNEKGALVHFSAEDQYQKCLRKDWLYLLQESSDGDIIFVLGIKKVNQQTIVYHSHVGILYPIFSVIHAAGRPCQEGTLPQVPQECEEDAFIKQRICGKIRKVVVTPLDKFGQWGPIDPSVCRPQP